MKRNRLLQYISKPSKVFMTTLVMLCLLMIAQGIIIATFEVFGERDRHRPAATEEKLSEKEELLKKIRQSQKKFLPDGTIHQVVFVEKKHRRSDEPQKIKIYDTNDDLLWEGLSKDNPFEHLSWAERLRGWREHISQRRIRDMQYLNPDFSRSLIIPVKEENRTIEAWRYLPGKDYFVGYDTNGKRIGYAGMTGFVNEKQQVQSFGDLTSATAWCPENSYSPTLLWQTKRRIYEINFEKQQVNVLFESQQADIETFGLHKWRSLAFSTRYRPAITCRTADRKIHLIMREPKQILTVTIPDDWQIEFPGLTATKDEIFLSNHGTSYRLPKEYFGSPELINKWLHERQGKPINRWIELYKVEDNGKYELVNRYDWTIPGQTINILVTEDYRRTSQRYVSNVSPTLFNVIWRYFPIQLRQLRRYDDHWLELCAEIISELRPANMILNYTLSALMMVVAFGHGYSRRTCWGKIIFWLALVGLFNLAGLLTYLALNHTATIKCHACGKRRGLERDDCPGCGAQLPKPRQRKLDLILT
ncbi:hypothetical protein ACFL3G_09065 [Planctomycetota bacterium]